MHFVFKMVHIGFHSHRHRKAFQCKIGGSYLKCNFKSLCNNRYASACNKINIRYMDLEKHLHFETRYK